MNSETKSPADDLPQWDLSNIYSGLEAADYRSGFSEFVSQLEQCETYFDEKSIRRSDNPTDGSTAELGILLEKLLDLLNDLSLRFHTLDAFVYAIFTTDSYDAAATREVSKLEQLETRLRKLQVRFQGWLGSNEAQLGSLVEANDTCRQHAFFLKDTARQSQYLMDEALEGLAAEMAVDGGGAFGKLQGNVTSQLKVPWEKDGKVELLPIALVHGFCSDADAEIRKRAYDAEIEGWRSVRTTVAACMNGVKGTALTLAKRRGRESVLDVTLDSNNIDRPTLDALLGAIREAFPVFRRYLNSKAKKLGHAKLPWWDLFAPVGGAEQSFSWSQARAFIIEHFSSFSDDLGQMATAAFDRNWIDAGPRDGKRGGAYCMEVSKVEESRILANFDGQFDGVSTLAHELGHAYHNHCQAGLPQLLRGSPMALAETASIFCETLITEAALEKAGPEDSLAILESQLTSATQVCVDISSRFIFETNVFERRAESELSPDELCELMVSAQRETYGEAIDEETYHPYMWLWKPHYYSYGANFYNFPYAFGQLFALGLYAVYRREGESFLPRYKQLLRDTACDNAAPLAARFGIDITQPDFWRESLSVVAEQVERYETLS